MESSACGFTPLVTFCIEHVMLYLPEQSLFTTKRLRGRSLEGRLMTFGEIQEQPM